MDDLNSNGWSFDHHVLPAVDLPILSTPDSFVFAALEGLPSGEKQTYDVAPSAAPSGTGAISLLARRWMRRSAHARPLMSACRLAGRPRRSVSTGRWIILGTMAAPAWGPAPGWLSVPPWRCKARVACPSPLWATAIFLMGASALWTAAHYGIPLLLIVNNNRSYGNDVGHQKTMAENRGRPVENKWIGQSSENPRVDIPAQARSYGVSAGETVQDIKDLMPALEAGIKAVEAGECYDSRCGDGGR